MRNLLGPNDVAHNYVSLLPFKVQNEEGSLSIYFFSVYSLPQVNGQNLFLFVQKIAEIFLAKKDEDVSSASPYHH